MNSAGDPLVRFHVPESLRKHSPEFEELASKLEKRRRKVSSTSQDTVGNEQQAQLHLRDRATLVNETASAARHCRNYIEEQRQKGLLDRSTAEQAAAELEASDAAIFPERAALAKHRIKIQYGMLSYPPHTRVGDAYLASLAHYLPVPPGGTIQQRVSRDRHIHSGFRARLRKDYNPPDCADDPEPRESWCPITKRKHRDRDVKAAHIVPHAIGKRNAAYLFGLEPALGWEAIWSTRNGLMLYDEVEEALDAARLVIVPDQEDHGEYKVVILDDKLLNRKVGDSGLRFHDLDNQKLEFKTEARPDRRHLYLRYLCTLFRRRRLAIEDCEKDLEKVPAGGIWATPGQYVRRSIVKALAFEIGDVEDFPGFLENEAGLAGLPGQLSAEAEASMAIEIRSAYEIRQDKGEREVADDY